MEGTEETVVSAKAGDGQSGRNGDGEKGASVTIGGPAEAPSAAPSFTVPEGVEADYWRVGTTDDGKVAFVLLQGGENGKVLGYIPMEPRAVMRMMSAGMKLAHQLNPQMPLIQFG
jgi:hypothetical protein